MYIYNEKRVENMSNFKEQINEDIAEYQRRFPYMSHINKNEWAFNYWILDKIFHEDEEIIESKIIDYNDMGIDAYEIYEDTKEIYLIQNKYYSDDSKINDSYVKNDFLLRGITALENGTYKKSSELQVFFNKYKGDEDFTVYLQLFVTNNNKCISADNYIKQFNVNHSYKYIASIFYLDNIEDKYYGEKKMNKKQLSVKIESVNKGTILNINNEQYKLENVVDARYVFSPVVSVYRLYRDAIEKNYPIFDDNIREYLGNKGINKKIHATLLDKNERKNFFYYNNGITIICDDMTSFKVKPLGVNIGASFEIKNPQIVNGCQTVNSIYQALDNIPLDSLEEEFKDTFVMLKILEINREKNCEDELCNKIVKYNNSQNKIDEKTFQANNSIFARLQTEFEKRGFLLLLKQSDKNKFENKYKVITNLKKLNSEKLKKFGIDDFSKAKDVTIPIEKLLQVIVAFSNMGSYSSYTKKPNLLKFGSDENKLVINFIKNVTTDVLIDLYLLYMRAEQEKNISSDLRTPIPYYLIDAFSLFDCEDRNIDLLREKLSSENAINTIVKKYTAVTKYYAKRFSKQRDIEYNQMIKTKIDYSLLKESVNYYYDYIAD